MAERYRDSQGCEFDAAPAAAGEVTWQREWRDLQQATMFLRNTRAGALPGRTDANFAAAIADGGAVFWCCRDFEAGVTHTLTNPADYEGALSPRFCQEGFKGRVVNLRVWAKFDVDIGDYLPGGPRDNDVGEMATGVLYLDAERTDEATAELRFSSSPGAWFEARISRETGLLQATLRMDPSPVDLAAAARFHISCGPAFSPPAP